MKIKQPVGILHVGIYRHIYIYTHKHRYTHTIMYKPRAGDYESKKRLKSGKQILAKHITQKKQRAEQGLQQNAEKNSSRLNTGKIQITKQQNIKNKAKTVKLQFNVIFNISLVHCSIFICVSGGRQIGVLKGYLISGREAKGIGQTGVTGTQR